MKSSTNTVLARVLIVVAGVLLLVGLKLAVQPAEAANEKVAVCHATSSTSNPWVAQLVNANQLQSHLDNGDFLYLGPLKSNGQPTTAGDAWCQANVVPTPTPTPRITPTPTPTLVPFPTPTFPFIPIFIPTPSPSPSISPTPTITPELILEDSPRITPTPTPSASPTPTPTPDSDATGGEGDETDCCPGQDEPEPVSTSKAPRVAAAKTKTAPVAITEFPSTGFSWPVPAIAAIVADALATAWALKNR